jgi:hypothetical protein
MALFSLAGIICSFFLITLVALLICLYLMNTGTLGMMGLKTLSFSKAWILLSMILTTSTGS